MFTEAELVKYMGMHHSTTENDLGKERCPHPGQFSKLASPPSQRVCCPCLLASIHVTCARDSQTRKKGWEKGREEWALPTLWELGSMGI